MAIQNGYTIDIVRIKTMKRIKQLDPQKILYGYFGKGFDGDTSF
jgi:hypothetical protein